MAVLNRNSGGVEIERSDRSATLSIWLDLEGFKLFEV
jgi:hypothetical protein